MSEVWSDLQDALSPYDRTPSDVEPLYIPDDGEPALKDGETRLAGGMICTAGPWYVSSKHSNTKAAGGGDMTLKEAIKAVLADDPDAIGSEDYCWRGAETI